MISTLLHNTSQGNHCQDLMHHSSNLVLSFVLEFSGTTVASEISAPVVQIWDRQTPAGDGHPFQQSTCRDTAC